MTTLGPAAEQESCSVVSRIDVVVIDPLEEARLTSGLSIDREVHLANGRGHLTLQFAGKGAIRAHVTIVLLQTRNVPFRLNEWPKLSPVIDYMIYDLFGKIHIVVSTVRKFIT